MSKLPIQPSNKKGFWFDFSMFEGPAGPQWLTEYPCTWKMTINTALRLLSEIQGPSAHLKEMSCQSACPNVTAPRPPDACTRTPRWKRHHRSKAVLCLSCDVDVNAASQVQGPFLPELLHCSSKALTRPLLLPGRFKWGWLKLRVGVILSVLLKHTVKTANKKSRNAIKTVLLYKWGLACLPQLPQQPFFPPLFPWQWALKRPQRCLYADQRNSFYKQTKKGLY